MKKAIFMGTPDFAVPSLETLFDSPFSIELVITQPDRKKDRGKKMQPPPVKERAEQLGIAVYQPDRIKQAEAIHRIRQIAPDLIVVTAYGQILPKEILEIPTMSCINVHASLLPKYRGAAPINYALIDGEEQTGITTMYMSEGLDTGDMILQDAIRIEPGWNSQTLHDVLATLSKETLKKTLGAILDGSAPRIPQEESQSSYAKMMTKSLGHIDWSKDAKTICNLIRGTVPWPGAYCLYKGDTMKILEAEVSGEYAKEPFGTIVDVSKAGIFVSAADYRICIKEIQMPGKKRMPVSEYLKGNSIKTGERLK